MFCGSHSLASTVYVKPLPEGKLSSTLVSDSFLPQDVPGKQLRRIRGEDRNMAMSLFLAMMRKAQESGRGDERQRPRKG